MGNKLTPRKRRKKRDKNYPKMNETISGRSQNGIFLHFTAGQSRSVCAGRRKIDVVVENSKIEYMNVKKNCGVRLGAQFYLQLQTTPDTRRKSCDQQS